ncbi:uncharacterized protein N7473_012495 [Penicillium subrubescens]|uniref:Pal1 cell morphology n=1 Tax=Penicillium subrubescens TaxID=1316194 RepID=A0A1Q5SRL3_9EURO|nr:uncharacterized protein N7473_012495 [Penicillium subrubescens]KAJ5875148.1 hypothetical protein N7473_012495 [Penicillium subrubescens]OKO90641.1 hypothetical protein PENSUB_13358 [Penicillium subrubescens]
MAAVDCMSMASRHHPHHPYNHQHSRDRRSSYSTLGSNNPYARYMSPAPSGYSHSKRSLSETFPSVPTVSMDSLWWSGSPEHQPVYPRHQRESSAPRRRRSQQRYSRNSHLVNPDIIDELDDVTSYSYHHEGPYDAVCPERNRVSHHSPLEAVRESNEEALRATPRDKIIDCLHSHRPLDGTAYFPPGTTDRDGQTYEYEEGSNMMDEYGLFMRLPGQKFTDEDFKNDPFYNRPISNPFLQLKKKLSLRRNKKPRSTA